VSHRLNKEILAIYYCTVRLTSKIANYEKPWMFKLVVAMQMIQKGQWDCWLQRTPGSLCCDSSEAAAAARAAAHNKMLPNTLFLLCLYHHPPSVGNGWRLLQASQEAA
jgi:hypothetical protein